MIHSKSLLLTHAYDSFKILTFDTCLWFIQNPYFWHMLMIQSKSLLLTHGYDPFKIWPTKWPKRNSSRDVMSLDKCYPFCTISCYVIISCHVILALEAFLPKQSPWIFWKYFHGPWLTGMSFVINGRSWNPWLHNFHIALKVSGAFLFMNHGERYHTYHTNELFILVLCVWTVNLTYCL